MMYLLIQESKLTYFFRYSSFAPLQPPYSCHKCPKVFENKKKYRKHVWFHKERTFHCELCAKSFLSPGNLTSHISRVHKKLRTFSCNLCDYSAASKDSLQKHVISQHTRDFPFKCDSCPLGFFSSRQLDIHRQLRHEGVNFICEFCSKIFKDLSYFKKHVKKHQRITKTFDCPECSRTFDYKSRLNAHVKKVHTNPENNKMLICDECGKCISAPNGMVKHKRIHTGEKTHVCEHCGKGFAVKNTLIAHLRVHTKERPFKCSYCEKSFTQKGSLNIHCRIHTGVKPYKCEICTKCYISKSALKSHKCKGGT